MSTAEKRSERPERNQDLRCQSGPSAQRFSHLQWRRLFKELWSRTNNDCRFRISILTSSLRQQPLLAEDKVQDRGMYLFTISYGSDAMDQGSGVVDSVDELRSSSSTRGYFNAEFCST